MLKLMRDNLKHLTWVLAAVIVAFVFSVFADYGGQNSWLGGGSSSSWAAVVNGEEITVGEFYDQARQLDRYYRGLLGEAYNPQQFNLNIGQQAINQIIQNRVILGHARSLGLTATAGEIRDEIVKDPSLQGANGFIGVSQYKDLLRANGRNAADYENNLSRQVLLRKWVEVVTADIIATDRQIESAIRRRDERADVVFARFQPSNFMGQVEVDESAVAAYYSDNEDSYRRGEGRKFEILILDRLREQRDIVVPEADMRADYDAALQSRFRIPEQRRASHILIKTPATMTDAEITDARGRAEAVLGRVQAGEDFGEVAKETSEDTSAENGGDLGFFGRGVMTVPFEQAVWGLAAIGNISDLVRSEFGFHIIELTGMRDSRLQPFEEVREQLQREVAFRLAGDKVKERAQQMYEQNKDRPENLKDAAARESRVVSETPAVYAGDPIPGIGPNAEVERALFSLADGELSEPIATPRGYVIGRFVALVPGGAPPLEEIKERVEGDLRLVRAAELARELVDSATAKADGRTLKEIGEELGFDVEEVAQVARGTGIGSLGIRAEIEQVIFSADVGVVNGPLESEDETVLLEVGSRQALTTDEITDRTPAMRAQIMTSRRQLAVSAVTRQLLAAADIEYNVALIQQVDAPATTTASTN